MIEIDNKKYYSINDVADILELNKKTVWKRIKDGNINAVKKRKKWFISEKELEKIPGKGEVIMPERFHDCIRYPECLDINGRQDKIFGCVGCGRYGKEAEYQPQAYGFDKRSGRTSKSLFLF